MTKPRATLSPAAAMRREDRLQQREDRLTDKTSDLRAQIASLTAENERLRNDLRDWAECCKMDTVMQGPARMGWNRSALDRCLAKYEAALQPKEGVND